VQYRNPVPGVVVVIIRDGKVLLGCRRGVNKTGKWCLPQGFMEFDEDFLTAGIREVKEETGLEVKILSILNVVSNKLSPGLHTLAIILQAEVVGGELSGGDDLEKPGWFDMSEALPEMAFDSDRQVIDRFRDSQLKQVLPVDPGYAV
jgi:ADP-ribose pyrophosphatase YjhB (NUDIX family)